ncbi:MAG TPA: hypothetical protein DEF00_05235 [Candidatus Taylorbacteria bacterium]|nr:MAG: hypothetical protein UY03_C0015G0014 [Parcubacteria group bacterium GW2011_GWA2_47_64]KKU97247.1 MAG: hypothetical protein UY29_C0001G0041 [Parcubacteria group bacterium GW2011_GWC2_48_17]HBV01751.1 hypothetical protein [Candidatus Taylorbacteria bacterium]
MSRFFPISILSTLVLLGTVIPFAHVANAQQQTNPPGETKYDDAYVPCGYADTKDKQGKPAEQTITLPDGTTKTIPGDGVVDNPCKFTHIIELAKKLIMGWIIAGVIIATMGFAYAGLLYITAMGSSEKVSHAHSIFIKTFWGFVFMLSAWLIAYTMESIFLSKEAKCNSFLTTPEDRVKLGCPTTP